MTLSKKDVRPLSENEISIVSGAEGQLTLNRVFVFDSPRLDSPLSQGFGLGNPSGRLTHVRLTDGSQ